MNQNTTIAVLGGGGRTGKFLINQLIEKGYRIKALIRNPVTFQVKSPLLRVIQGDAVDVTAVNRLINGCQAVISTIGQRSGEPLVAEQATQNVLDAMSYYGVSRYVLVAGINIDTPFDRKGPETIMATNWMKTNYPTIQEDRQKAYDRLAKSNVKWTLVRVPFIIFTDGTGEMGVNLDNCLGNKVDAGHIATSMIKQLYDDSYFNEAPFIYNA